MHHLLANATSARIARMGAEWEMLVLEHAPHAEHLYTLGFVSVDEELIARHNLLTVRVSR